MFRKSFLAATAAISVVGLTAVASFASAGSAVINEPLTGTQTVSFPYVQAVSVTFSHGEASVGEDLCDSDWTITIVGPAPSTAVVYADSGAFVAQGTGAARECSAADTQTVTGTATISEPGTYTVLANLDARKGSHDGDDTETPVYQLTTSGEIGFDHKAAPAVANDLLNTAPKVKGKDRQGCVSKVAHHMGSSSTDQSGTDFNGVAKSQVAAYRTQVEAFLDEYCLAY